MLVRSRCLRKWVLSGYTKELKAACSGRANRVAGCHRTRDRKSAFFIGPTKLPSASAEGVIGTYHCTSEVSIRGRLAEQWARDQPKCEQHLQQWRRRRFPCNARYANVSGERMHFDAIAAMSSMSSGLAHVQPLPIRRPHIICGQLIVRCVRSDPS